MSAAIRVEVAYARPEVQAVERVVLPAGGTVLDAIRASGLLERFPEIDLAKARVGIFGLAAQLGDSVEEGDRVEIYRPLVADAKAARRERAGRSRSKRR
ncbi:RnfH family protein [Sulfurifustis variabilis]|uniref:RnfH family protein n=1 Tax=Sulfurifustis variabilis TaxID=1675686 RepID=UPI000BBA53C9|nr:RnfH family protein [Sulfurifustis variabilis]